jgi:hypothetical protein
MLSLTVIVSRSAWDLDALIRVRWCHILVTVCVHVRVFPFPLPKNNMEEGWPEDWRGSY